MKPEQAQNHSCDPPQIEIGTATKEEIIAVFKRYNFQDSLGHPLTMCQDFHELLNRIRFQNTTTRVTRRLVARRCGPAGYFLRSPNPDIINY
jgi:hypothetical protein